MLDLDGFNGVNDRLGHPAGDEVLRHVARILQRSRLSDGCFRIGGDEFAILMPETSLEEAGVAIRRVVADIRSTNLDDGPLGASFGIAAAGDRDGSALLAAADRELLRAKDRLYGRAV